MNLSEALEELEARLPERGGWKVWILTRTRDDGSVGDDVLGIPVFEVSVDADDEEINLITDEFAESPRPHDNALSLADLIRHFKSLEAKYRNYSVFSGSAWRKVDDEYEGRKDMSLVGVMQNPEAEIVGFLQGPEEQW